MTHGWVEALALVKTADMPRSEDVLGRHLSGLDATYRTEECLGVELATEEDEALFRLTLLDETTTRDIRVRYAASARLSSGPAPPPSARPVRRGGRARDAGLARTPGRARAPSARSGARRGALCLRRPASPGLAGVSDGVGVLAKPFRRRGIARPGRAVVLRPYPHPHSIHGHDAERLRRPGLLRRLRRAPPLR
jgi:hypothetical protein